MSLTRILLGVGSNIDREAHLCAGLDALAGLLSNMRCSPVFESQAIGIKSGTFFNLVVVGFTELPLAELNRQLKFIEADNGRYAPERKGLPLDIDVLLYGDLVGDFNGLIVPRAEILKNAFVLWPLALLVPDVLHPAQQRRFADLWHTTQIEQRLWPIAFNWHDQPLTPATLTQAYPAP